MSRSIAGIDFSAIADFRKSVKVKLSETQTVELPLILARDAGMADLLHREVGAVRMRYASLMVRLEDMQKEALAAVKEEYGEDVTVNSGSEVSDRLAATQIEHLQKLQELTTQAASLHDRVLNFLTPYLKNIKLETGEPLISRLAVLESVKTFDILACMFYGEAALQDTESEATEEDEEEESKKKNNTSSPST